ncbi:MULTISPECIES: flagellar biosynthesis anti-sigma factor FlgM [Edwardsiella]|uniref:Negative regulator of flagellin synthesis n=2 Tax=Edwardsiella anguillarum TaxID=1821960 RepID=A0A076LNZ8_9GAMM|nr:MULTISPECIES: flagellar biosynthesis anti-sigma factor FlgM [Edwardsiella]AKM48290.1 flagellar biosynthesis anti-sigma factor FlgM [Edwardsiella sp. EA181011]GAJ66503.1 negative regulator of flagellin synthesis FlgM [Edwardsiella piscicida]AIJ09596.1 Negative regulator of flagellin synthesis FlgM [Edwardsiella anguillarum ET080813]AKR77354.1 anti-sigma-28 factor FlgM [Edwardsiella sp. LADL05-105]KAB0592572.1 anti-sigma-28 factor FlgM [Edwardsiella anguillarum]
MSIDRTSALSAISHLQAREPQDAAQQTRKIAASQESVVGTQVKLSDAQARLMQPNSRDINTTRVEALKQAIRSGELKMDTGKIADALLQDTFAYLKDK